MITDSGYTLGLRRLCIVSLLSLVLAACSEVSVEGTQIEASMAMPSQLRDLRALSDPSLEIKINQSSVPVTQDSASGLWHAEFNVTLNQQHFIEISWTDQSFDPPLDLMQASEWFSASSTEPINLVFESDQFDASFDADNDGRSNLLELKADTNPMDRLDPPEPVQTVILNVELAKPQELVEVQAVADDNLLVRATLDNGPLPLTRRDDLNWFGQRSGVPAELPVFITIEWCYRLSSGDLLRLLRFAREIDMREIEGEFKFLTEDSVSYRGDYDLDANGISNIDEIANGSVPMEAGQSRACQ